MSIEVPFEIESGVTLPPIERAVRDSKYPFAQMNVNDSFFVEGVNAQSLHACVSRFCKGKGAGWKFTVRTVTVNDKVGVRVWRIE